MLISNLAVFDIKLFRKMFGLLVRQYRLKNHLTFTELATTLNLTEKKIQQIELGKHKLSQDQFELICEVANLDKEKIFNIYKITHVDYLMKVYRTLDENYPK